MQIGDKRIIIIHLPPSCLGMVARPEQHKLGSLGESNGPRMRPDSVPFFETFVDNVLQG